VFGHSVFGDEKSILLFFEMEVFCLPAVRKIVGPPVFATENAHEFRKKYAGGRLRVEEEHWMAEVKRQYREPTAYLARLLRRPVRELKEIGIASYVATALSPGGKILDERGLFSLARKNREFCSFLYEYAEGGK
jgi:tRNA nucleotidyltransferase (CCA-adding enzyme)